MVDTNKHCPDCGAPLATQELHDAHPDGCQCDECEAVCWREYWSDKCTRIGKGEPPHDWQAEAMRLREALCDIARNTTMSANFGEAYLYSPPCFQIRVETYDTLRALLPQEPRRV